MFWLNYTAFPEMCQEKKEHMFGTFVRKLIAFKHSLCYYVKQMDEYCADARVFAYV